MSVRDDYFRFEIEEEKQENDIFSKIIKSLIIVLLGIAILSLGIVSYRYIVGDEQNKVENKVVVNKPIQQPQQNIQPNKNSTTLKKEEIALIIKAVLAEIQKNSQKVVVTKEIKKSEDSELLSSLQNMQPDDTTYKAPKKKDIKKVEKIAHKKIKDKIIKKQITYNAVVIDNKAVKDIDELSKLYAQINRISKKKKKKILKNAYTKKIRKEIIIRENAMRTITVRPGDTLGAIARRAYGKSSMYKKIFEANPDILTNPHSLKVGMKLRVPK